MRIRFYCYLIIRPFGPSRVPKREISFIILKDSIGNKGTLIEKT